MCPDTGPQAAYTRGGMHGDLMSILRPIHRGILQFVGFDVLAPHVVYGPARMAPEERQAQLAAFADRLNAVDQEERIEAGEC
jgi:NAD(P)H dehydrogenase (quinone)